MKALLIFSVAVFVASAQQCKPRFHYWRPFNGTIPNDAFVASTDQDGKRSFVAKIVPMDQYSWTVPTQFTEGTCNHLEFAWCCKSDNTVMRVDEFIEILCTDTPQNLSWRKVNAFASEISSKCCMVQGGIGWYGDRIYRAFIGKGLRENRNFIGRIYLEHEWPGVHIMDGATSTKIYKNFEVLTYDCEEKENVVPVV
ncbi:uncharacterized protein LOC123316905 [Coccinella septempunctata]|uniref:uncharacterized protein LOC123316905 n=1 Tax=Coccinella septempunctata TaxID=41139 RepID=UPI001D095F3F|nr:uncharacterized protein LOC123316905 [Coccinella septempunctata]